MRSRTARSRRSAAPRRHQLAGKRQRRRAFALACAAGLPLLACASRVPSGGRDALALESRTEGAGVATALPSPRGTPKYPATSVPLSRDSDYLRRAASPDYWALSPHYVGQERDASCSLASLTMLVNAARRHQRLGSDEPMVLQRVLQARVNSAVWERGLAPGGEGVTLDELGLLAEQSLRVFGFSAPRVQVTHVPEASPPALARLREALLANEANGDDWLFVNFLASVFVGVGDYGHIAPVGAYDAGTRRVLIFDPDRTWYEPYWVPDEVVLSGMATRDSVTGKPRGYLQVSLRRSD